MPEDGTCPTCKRVLVDAASDRRTSSVAESPRSAATRADAGTAADPYDIDVKALAGESGKTPWHFKLLVIAIIAYLGWRLVQGIVWVSGHM
ncbi:MAG: hypothetical protein JWL70_2123 [Acidimicrobiia bacterium]|nr:hypothetical protein [Acidimicrobiia bacterium]